MTDTTTTPNDDAAAELNPRPIFFFDKCKGLSHNGLCSGYEPINLIAPPTPTSLHLRDVLPPDQKRKRDVHTNHLGVDQPGSMTLETGEIRGVNESLQMGIAAGLELLDAGREWLPAGFGLKRDSP
jgi:hypothetical protein